MGSKCLPKSIYLVGPHSTGKSTLANALIKHYGSDTQILQEIARKVLKQKGYSALTILSDKCFKMQKDIFEAQYEAEDILVDKGQYFISDRNAVDPIVYTKMYSPGVHDWENLCNTEEWKILRARYSDETNSLVVLFEPIQEFLVNDGTRKMPEDWDEWVKFGNMFTEFLNEQRIPYQILGDNYTDLGDRVEKVVEWAEN